MDPDRWREVDRLFEEALDRPPARIRIPVGYAADTTTIYGETDET
jgi:hypothetical protein